MSEMKFTIFILFISFMTLNMAQTSNNQRCGGNYTCCSGYRWDNAQRQCIACDVGYFGVNCTYPCPDLSYGRDCQQLCSCKEESCNHIVGCVESGAGLHISKESPTILHSKDPLGARASSTLKTTEHRCIHSMRSSKQSVDSYNTTIFIAIVALGVCFMTFAALYLKFNISNGVCSGHVSTQQNGDSRDENAQIYEEV